MRILHAIPYYAPAQGFGGPAAVCRALAEEMVARGHSVTVLTTDAASRRARLPALRETLGGVEVVRARNLSLRLARRANAWLPLGLSGLAAEWVARADVVHAHELFHLLSWKAVQLAARRGVPAVLSGHGGLSLAPERGRVLPKRAFWAALGRRTVDRCAAIQVANAAEEAAGQKLGIPGDRFRVIPNGVRLPPLPGDARRFREKWKLDHRPIALFAGRLQTQKGIDLLLRLRAPGAIVALAGLEENRPDLAAPGWRGGALVCGPLDGQELADAFSAASLFVLPSQSEGQPLAALEALSYGLPCLLTSACNLPEVAAAGAGLSVPAAEFEGALLDLLAHPERWPGMSRAARTLAEARFDRVSSYDSWESLYRELAHG